MEYYKILSNDLTHYGMIYKLGLNIDIKEFDPDPRCGGGIFFTDIENIFNFIDYGNKLAILEIPDNETIVKVDNKYKSHSIIIKEIKELYNIDTIKYLVKQGVDIHALNDYALRCASKGGYLDIVKYLVGQGADIHADDDYALRYASEEGHLDVVKYLVEHGTDIHADDDYALRYASEEGHLDVVKYLVENGANIHAYDDCALRYASWYDHYDIVNYLKSL